MKRGGVSVFAALDEAAELVPHEVPGWAGLLALTSLPLRFLEAHFVNRLIQLGDGASEHLGYLLSLSLLISLALVPALWGRAVFAHACTLALSGQALRGQTNRRGVPVRAGLRLPLPGLVSYLYAGIVAETLFLLFGWTFVAIPVFVLFSGLVAATAPLHDRPGVLASLAVPLRHARPAGRLLGNLFGLSAICGLGLGLAFLSLQTLFQLGVWLAGATGADLSWWAVAFGWTNAQFLLLVLAGAALAVEPFWIAALVAATRRARAHESGEDLAAWFAEIRSARRQGGAA